MSLSSFSKAIHKYAAVLLCLFAAACGGGGGGNSSGGDVKPSTGFQVSVDRSALRFEAEEGRPLSPIVVLGSGTGTPPSIIYTGSIDLGTSLELVNTEVIGTQIKFTVYPKSNLPVGTYTGNLQLFACVDAKCAQHFTGSPATIPYTIVITKAFNVSPQTISMAALAGTSASRDVSVSLPPTQSSFQVNTSATWLSVTNLTTTGFTIKTATIPPGTYYATVSVSYPGRNIDIPVSYNVTTDSSTVTQIIPDLTNLNFNAIAGAPSTPAVKLNLTLPTWAKESKASVTYLTNQNNWLNVTKINELSYSITASPQDLVTGTHVAHLIISTDSFTPPAAILVNFVVGAPSWNIAGNTNFEVNGETQGNQLSSELSIDVPSLPAQGWTASSSATWLKLINTSGTTGVTKLLAIVNTDELFKMENFTTATADVTISSVSGKIAAKNLSFTLNKKLPEMNYLSPSTRMPGEAVTSIVRGRGFNSIVNLDQAVSATGTAPKRITRINDTQLNVEFGAVDQGETSLSMKNTLNIPTGAVSLKVVAPRSFAYRAIETQGAKGALFFDAERQAVFTVNKELGTVMRFAANGANWTITTANVTSIDSAAMSPDGKSIVATSTNGKITLIDPSSMEVQTSYNAPGPITGDTLNSLPRLAVTNNGKAFFQGGFYSNGMNYFDLKTRRFGSLTDNTVQFNFYSGPWFNVSGDGDRLIVVQSASISPAPKMLYMDSSNEQVRVNPAGIDFWYEAAQSLHGERFMEGTYKVWDRNFNLVGNVVLPNNEYFGRNPTFSPDGNRAYILTYSSNAFSNTTTPSIKPRVYVIDTSTRLVTTTTLPILGYFDFDDYPTCVSSTYGCNTRALGTISPDGKTLFYIGDKKLVVVPIPASLTPASPPPLIQQAPKTNKAAPNKMTRHEIAR